MNRFISASSPPDRIGLLWALGASLVFTAACVFVSPLVLIALVGGAGAFAAVFLLPEIGIILTVASIPLEQVGSLLSREGGGVGGLTLAKVFGALTIAAWLARVAVFGQKVWIPRAAVLFAAFIAAGVISLVDAIDFGPGIGGVVRLVTTLAFILAVVNIIDSRKKFERCLAAFLIATVLTSGYAIAQRFIGSADIGNLNTQLIAEGRSQGLMVDHFEADQLGQAVKRSGGTTFHPVKQGFNNALVIPLLAVAFFFAPRGPLRLVALVGLAVTAAALVASGSRSPLLALFVAGLIMVGRQLIPINRHTVLAGLAAVIIGWFAVPDDLKSRLFSVGSYSAAKSYSWELRNDLQTTAIQIISQYPFNGIGIGNLTELPKHTRIVDTDGAGVGPHNMYLLILMQMGFLGFAVLMWFFFSVLSGFRRAAKAWRGRGDEWMAKLSLTLGMCVWVVLVQGMTLDLIGISMQNAWFLIALQPVLLRLAETEP